MAGYTTLDAAKALIAELIRGDVDETTYTSELIRLPTSRVKLFPKHSPITSITTLIEGSTTLTSTDYEFDLFGITRLGSGKAWPSGTDITITYITGWATGTAPIAIMKACDILADVNSTVLSDADGSQIVEEAIGHARTKYATVGGEGSATAAIPSTVSLLLANYIRP